MACRVTTQETTISLSFDAGMGVCTEIFDQTLSRFLSDEITQIGEPIISEESKEVNLDVCCQNGEFEACETNEV